jgi:hypothetical protein
MRGENLMPGRVGPVPASLLGGETKINATLKMFSSSLWSFK